MLLYAKPKAITRKIKRVGLPRTLMLVVVHFRNLIFYRNRLVYRVDIPAYEPSRYAQKGDLSAARINNVDDLTEDDLRAINSYVGQQYFKTMQDKFKKNWVLYLAYIDGELGGAAWVVPNFSEFKTRSIRYIDNAVSIIDCWTIPEHRGKSVFPFLLTHIIDKLRANALDNAFIEVNERNYASIKGIEKAGFQLFLK